MNNRAFPPEGGPRAFFLGTQVVGGAWTVAGRGPPSTAEKRLPAGRRACQPGNRHPRRDIGLRGAEGGKRLWDTGARLPLGAGLGLGGHRSSAQYPDLRCPSRSGLPAGSDPPKSRPGKPGALPETRGPTVGGGGFGQILGPQRVKRPSSLRAAIRGGTCKAKAGIQPRGAGLAGGRQMAPAGPAIGGGWIHSWGRAISVGGGLGGRY